MLIPNLRTPPASAATAPVLSGAVQRWGAALLAASVLSSTPFTPPAFAATPTTTELSRIAEVTGHHHLLRHLLHLHLHLHLFLHHHHYLHLHLLLHHQGLARIDYLLDNWDKLTTVCKGTPDELERKQTVKIVDGLGGTRCSKSPLIVQKFIGAG